MLTALNKFCNWLLLSASQGGQASLTAKGFLVAAIPTVIYFLGLGHIQTDQDTLTAIIDGFFNIVQAVSLLAAAIIAFTGLVRKFFLTATGQNVQVPS